MRLPLLALLLALALARATLASPPVVDTARYEELIGTAAGTKNNVIKINSSAKYKQLVIKSGRDWESIVLLSASQKVGCARCPEWEEALGTAALAYKSTLKSGEKPKVFFFYLRFDDAQEVYQMYALNHAPTLIWVSSDSKLEGKDPSKLHTPRTLQLSHMEYVIPDDIAGFVSSRTGYKFEIYYSPTSRVLTFIGVLVFLVATSRWLLVLVVPALRRAKWLWFAVSMLAYSLGVSGTIYVYLRNMPNYGKGEKGGISYFAGDRNQFAYEGYLVGAILLASSASLVISAFGYLPKPIAMLNPIVHLSAVIGFALLFKFYLTLYLQKSNWYEYGFQGNGLVWPWL